MFLRIAVTVMDILKENMRIICEGSNQWHLYLRSHDRDGESQHHCLTQVKCHIIAQLR